MNDEKMNEAEVKDENENNTEPEKDINPKIDTAFKAIMVGMVAVFLLQYPDIVYRIPYEAVVAVISSVVLILCISVAIFSFVKPRAWLYRGIAAAVSLFAGIIGFLNLYNETFEYGNGYGSIYIPEFLMNINTRLFVPIFIAICLAYAAVIFGSALLVQYIYKKRKNKTTSTT